MVKISELIIKTEEMLVLLDNDEGRHWYNFFEKALGELKNSNAHGCRRILSASGGMGSYNDFSLNCYKAEVKRQALWEDIYVLASDLWKENNS